jgi:FAD-dependent urate hydroxylase
MGEPYVSRIARNAPMPYEAVARELRAVPHANLRTQPGKRLHTIEAPTVQAERLREDRAQSSGTRGATIDALVLEASLRQSLVAVRELGGEGLKVGALSADAHAPALASRWCAEAIAAPDVARDADVYVNAVLRACAELGPRSLIVGHDGAIEALRRRREEVERVVGLALAPEPALAVAIDKTRTLAFARALGLRAPRGAFVSDARDAASALDEVGLPAVVKPTRSWAQNDAERLSPILARERAVALAAIEEVLAYGIEVVVQEWLPGVREAISFMYADGRTWARFAQRADRTFPPLGGGSVVRESVPLPNDVAPAAERLVAELGLDGYSEVEFRRDADGRPALMEINPRLSASVEIAVRAGVPFARLLHDWASGERLRQIDGYRAGLKMRWLGGDLSWLRNVLKQPSGPDVPSRGRALATFAGDFARPMAYDYLDGGDMRPAVSATAGAVRRAGAFLLAPPQTAESAAVRPRNGVAAAPTSAGLDAEAIVIGAGPYGLSVSAHMTGRGVSHETFGDPMSLWGKHMPEGMFLKSEGFASNLGHPDGRFTLEDYCKDNEPDYEYRDVASPIPLRTFERYGRWFQRNAVPRLREQRVEHVRRVGDGFEVRVGGGELLRARSVVVATGMTDFARVPEQLQGLPPETVLHCYDHRDPSASAGTDVAVIGAGQSALESAALLAESGARVFVVARTMRFAWNSRPGGFNRPLRERWKYPESGLGEGRSQWVYSNFPMAFHCAPERQRLKRAFTVLGPAGAWWLRERIEGKVQPLLGRAVLGAEIEDGRVRLQLHGPSGREELVVEQAIMGTGYRPELERLSFLDAELRREIRTQKTVGTPLLDRGFQSNARGVYFVGYPAALAFGPVMRFVYGAEFAARTLARSIAG